MKKPNCWEFMRCGREPGGRRVRELGICPAAECGRHDGCNDGVNGGRYCWRVEGTLCGAEVGPDGERPCFFCPFFQSVREQQGAVYNP